MPKAEQPIAVDNENCNSTNSNLVNRCTDEEGGFKFASDAALLSTSAKLQPPSLPSAASLKVIGENKNVDI
jgi:hypothetical protein